MSTVTMNGQPLSDVLAFSKLPDIKHDRVTKARFCNAFSYAVQLDNGMTEYIVGENAYQRTIAKLKEMK